jgi:mannose-6-phosphate isomerase
MAPASLYPMTFVPVLKDYIWGGRRLEQLLGRQLPPGVTAESWEIAAHKDGTAIVANGHFAGRLLTEVHAELGLDLIGRNSAWAQQRGKFPLLVKLLDADQHLSVQVHPDDEYAKQHEGNELGKTEMWVVLYAEPEAALIMGVTANTTPEKFYRALTGGNLSPYLHRLPVHKGDAICVPSGSLHAILGGLVIAEIQQNSNTTYRVYDWNRLKDGKPRPLHIDKAMDVINFSQIEPGLSQPTLVDDDLNVRRYLLCRNSYFVTERVEMKQGAIYRGHCDGSTFEIWGSIEGQVQIDELTLPAVKFALLPASMGTFAVHATEDSSLLRTYVAPN